jgi:Zn-dependent protease
MLTSSLPELISRALMLIIVFPAHELAHALVATYFGDPTPRAAGRLTLNPLKHLDVFGSLLFIAIGIGWAQTPINPAYFGENARMKMGLVSFAGPFTNLLLCMLGMIPFIIFGWSPVYEQTSGILPSLPYFFTIFMIFNLLLAILNLFPIAPLDGSRVLGAFLPEQAAVKYDALQRYGMILFLVIFFILPQLKINLLGWILQLAWMPIELILNLLVSIRLGLF